VELYNELAQRHGWKVLEPHAIASFRQMGLRERFLALEMPFYRLPLLGRELKRMYAARMDQVAWNPGVVEALHRLDKEGVSLGIVSSNSTTNIQKFLQRQEMSLIRSVHSVSGLFGKHRVLGRYLAEHALVPDQVLYVGDEERDVEAARRAGVRSIAVTWGADVEERLRSRGPARVVQTPNELSDGVLQLLDSSQKSEEPA